MEKLALGATCAPTMDTHLQVGKWHTPIPTHPSTPSPPLPPQLLQEVQWMAASSLRLQAVQGQRLREFVEAGMVELFMKPAMSDDHTRRRCGAPPQVCACVCMCVCLLHLEVQNPTYVPSCLPVPPLPARMLTRCLHCTTLCSAILPMWPLTVTLALCPTHVASWGGETLQVGVCVCVLGGKGRDNREF